MLRETLASLALGRPAGPKAQDPRGFPSLLLRPSQIGVGPAPRKQLSAKSGRSLFNLIEGVATLTRRRRLRRC